jgi:hypothetical protein
MQCLQCGLPIPRGFGDGISSCGCPRCDDCGSPDCHIAGGCGGDDYDDGTEYYYGRPVDTVVMHVGNAAIL